MCGGIGMEVNTINKKIAIAGPGVMGSSIAQVFARYGYSVVLYGRSTESLRKGKTLISINQQTSIAEGELTEDESNRILNLITYTCDINCFADADFVIEAIVENLNAKKTLWADISTIVSDNAILTSNTSGISITEIAKSVKKPERFAGMHWVNPPHIVPLVEVIKGEKTNDDTVKAIYDVAVKVGKKPITVKKEAKGFVLNRLQFAVLREAMHIVEAGIASKEDVDNVFKYGLGVRYACLGPFEIADIGGLDTYYNISNYLLEDLSDAKEVPSILNDLIQRGEYGVKSGKGFYDYTNGRDKEIIKKRDESFIKIAGCLYK